MAAISSIRLLVVCASPPCMVLQASPYRNNTPQPPGPGLPLQAPSVNITTLPAIHAPELFCCFFTVPAPVLAQVPWEPTAPGSDITPVLRQGTRRDRKSTRLNSSHVRIS